MTVDGLALLLFVSTVLLVLALVGLAVRARRLAAARVHLTRDLERAHATLAEGERTLSRETATRAELERGLAAAERELAETRERLVQMVAARDDLDRQWRRSEERARGMFDHAPFGALLVGDDGRILRANAALSEALGLTPAEVAVLRFEDLLLPGRTRGEADAAERLERGEIESYRLEGGVRRKEGEPALMAVTIVALRDADHRVAGRLVMMRDLTGARHDEEVAERFARHDALTGLANRLAFEERVRELVVKLTRERERMGVVFFDVDNAGAVADRLGGRARDELLRELTKCLQAPLSDTEAFSRVGVTSFAFALPRRGAAGTAQAVENLLASLADGIVVAGQRIHPDLRLGFAMFPEDASEASDLVRRADAALAHATHAGRRYVRFAEHVAV